MSVLLTLFVAWLCEPIQGLGLVSAVIRRKLRGTWTVTPWPLAAVLSPSEDTSHYLSAFQALAGALKLHKLPQPRQVNTDFFSGSGTAAAQTFKGIVLVHDMWHMRRNLMKNDKAAKSKMRLRSEGFPEVSRGSGRRGAGKGRGRGRAGGGKRKLPPHLSTRPIHAFLLLLNYLCFAPTRAYFHVLTEVVLNRVQWVWQQTDFVRYVMEQYLIRVKGREHEGVEWLWSARWWSGVSSRCAAGQPPSQQPSENLNAIVKNCFRAQPPASTHSEVMENFARSISALAAPLPAGSSERKPGTLMGREVRSGAADGPSDWMKYKGKTVRRPFAK